MLDYTRLTALLAIDDTGTFEGAARELNLSSFAIVQRIKTLEAKLGVKLIDRSPTRTTDIGKVLCDHTREVISLEGELTDQYRVDTLEADTGNPTLKIAIVDESLSNWFLAILGQEKNSEDRLRLDVQLTDSDQTLEMMKSGQIMAALTNDPQTIYGFKTFEIGVLTYRAVASSSYIIKHFPDGVKAPAFLKAPTIRINANDDRSLEWTRQVFGQSIDLPLSVHPSAQGTLQACLDGKIWTMQSDLEVRRHLASDELIELIPNKPLDRTLYWHVAGTMLDTIRPITRAIKDMGQKN